MTESRQWFVIDVIFVLVEFIVVAVEVMVLVIDIWYFLVAVVSVLFI